MDHGHLFIIQSTGQSKDTREQALQNAAAKSHASRVAHNRRKAAAVRSGPKDHVITQARPSCSLHRSMAGRAEDCKVCSPSSKLAVNNAATDLVAYGVHPGFGGYRHEVFVALSEENLSESRPVLDFWDYKVNPRYDLFTEIFDIQHPFLAFIREIGKPVFEFAGLSALSMILHKESGLTGTPPAKILAHKALAIKRVREQLRSDTWKEGTAMAIAFLAILASTMGEVGEVRHHLQALKRLIDQKGGLHALQSYERDDLLFLESGFSLNTGRPMFERRPWNPVYPASPLAFSSDIIPSGFVNVIREGHVSTDAILVLERTARATYRSNLSSHDVLSRSRRTHTRHFSDCIEACPILLAPDTDTTILEKMILFSLILYCAAESDSRGRSGWFKAGQQYLCRHLPHFQPCTTAERMCLAWLHILTADSYRRGYALRSIAKDGTDLLLTFLHDHEDFLLGRWPYLRAVVCQFFWPVKLSQYWSRSWDSFCQTVSDCENP